MTLHFVLAIQKHFIVQSNFVNSRSESDVKIVRMNESQTIVLQIIISHKD